MATALVVFASPFRATMRLGIDNIVNDDGLRVSTPFTTPEAQFAAVVRWISGATGAFSRMSIGRMLTLERNAWNVSICVPWLSNLVLALTLNAFSDRLNGFGKMARISSGMRNLVRATTLISRRFCEQLRHRKPHRKLL
ncbi:hypothetical protein [Bradyrhizobium sp. USDA 4523]